MSELFKRAKTWIEICWFYTCATLLIVSIYFPVPSNILI